MREVLAETKNRIESLKCRFNYTIDPEELDLIILEINVLEKKENYYYKKIKRGQIA